MTALRKSLTIPSEVVRDPSVMSGDPVVRGTRVPAMTIVAYLRAGRTNREIFEDYPTLPVDGIDAVIAWADQELGHDWRNASSNETVRP
ncbi:MAG: DUF433 domain-containing protein [Pseudolabrys sp.]